MTDLITILKATSTLVSDNFHKTNHRFFEVEHLISFCQKLTQYQNKGITSIESPFFEEECTPSLRQAYLFFESSMNDWSLKTKSENELATDFAMAIESAGIENLLLLMGQRLTPGSITNIVPPIHSTLISSASKIYDQTLIVAAREWTKHTNRSKDSFWGKIEGDTERKNKKAMSFIENILSNKTWWNVFYHYKHQLVYEARVSSGHGARWTSDGKKFIGFLEPFI